MAKNDLKIHPFAEFLPLMAEGKLEALAEDIRAHGLLNPIVRYQGQILDGRNRHRACTLAGVAPTFSDFEGTEAEALALVKSLNVHRRDLTSGQRAIAAALEWGLDEKTDGRPGKGTGCTVSLKSLAAEYHISKQTLTQARDLLCYAPDLAEAVKDGSKSMLAASQDYEERQRKAKQDARTAERVKKYADAIASGEMTTGQALAAITEEEQAKAADVSARQIWFDQLAKTIAWAREWVNDRKDERLDWYSNITTEEGEQEVFDAGVSREEVQEIALAVERILAHITFAEASSNGKKKKGRNPHTA